MTAAAQALTVDPVTVIRSMVRKRALASNPVRVQVGPPMSARPEMWLKFRVTKLYTYVTLNVRVARDAWYAVTVAVDHGVIRDALARRGISYQVGFSLGKLWKGIKKIAKKTGVSKVFDLAKTVLKNPAITAVFPVASLAARAVEAGGHMLDAATKAKSGKPADKLAAKAAIARAQQLAASGDPAAQSALQLASRAYRIVVTPL